MSYAAARWRRTMPRTLPDGIVAAVTELGAARADWCLAGRDQSLEAHEAAVLERVRRALPGLLRAVLRAATRGLAVRTPPGPAPCPRCGGPTPPHELARRRTLATQCGTLRLQRPWEHCTRCGQGFSVVETVLAVPEHARLSAGLHAWLVLRGATRVFRDGVAGRASLAGLSVGRETRRRHSHAAGPALADAADAARARVAITQEPVAPLDPAPGLLVVEVVEADGARSAGDGVRFLDGWHAVKLGLVGGWPDGRLQAPTSVAAREAAERFGARLAAAAATRGALAVVRWEGGVTGRGLAVRREAALLGEGAVWIWHRAAARAAARIEVVDA